MPEPKTKIIKLTVTEEDYRQLRLGMVIVDAPSVATFCVGAAMEKAAKLAEQGLPEAPKRAVKKSK